MTAAEHKARAEYLLGLAQDYDEHPPDGNGEFQERAIRRALRWAQVHATLATIPDTSGPDEGE